MKQVPAKKGSRIWNDRAKLHDLALDPTHSWSTAADSCPPSDFSDRPPISISMTTGRKWLTWNRSIATFLAKKWVQMQKRLGRRKVNTLASSECELSVDHITGHPVVQACTVWLPQCPSYSMDACISANKGFPINTIVNFSFLPEQTDDVQFCLPCRHMPAEIVSGEGDASWWPPWKKRIVRRQKDMRRPIPLPYRARETVARPATGFSWRRASSQCQTRWSAFFLPDSAATCSGAGRWDRARLAAHAMWRIRYPCHAQLMRFLKCSNCAAVKFSTRLLEFLVNFDASIDAFVVGGNIDVC